VLELSVKKHSVGFDGRVFELLSPTLKSIRGLEDKLKKVTDPALKIDVQGEFFVSLGMPEDIYQQLQIEHIEAISDLIMPAKKK